MKKSLSAVKCGSQREHRASTLITDLYDLSLDSKSCGWTIGGIDSRETTPASSPKAQARSVTTRKSNTGTPPITLVKFREESFSFLDEQIKSTTSTPHSSHLRLSFLFNNLSRESTPYSSSEELPDLELPPLAANYTVSQPIPIVQNGGHKNKFTY